MTYAMGSSGSVCSGERARHSRLPGRAPAHRRHGTGRIGAAAAPHRPRRGGALPRARSAAARHRRACGCRSRSATSPIRPSFRHALRGVRTVVHLAGAWRDQPAAGLEELNGLATWRLLRAAERAGVERFVFLSAARRGAAARAARPPRQGAGRGGGRGRRARDHRRSAPRRSTRPASAAPAAARRPGGRARAADPRPTTSPPACSPRSTAPPAATRRYELAGPRELSWRAFAALAAGRRRARRPAGAPAPGAARATRRSPGPAALLTWDEAARATAPLTTPRGTADAIALGVTPRSAPV